MVPLHIFCLCFFTTKILWLCHLNNTCLHDLVAAAPSTISSLDNIDFQKLQNGRYLKIAFFSYHVLQFTSTYFIKYSRYHLLIKSNVWNFDASWSWEDSIVLSILLVHFILRNCLIWQPPSQDFVAGVYWLKSVRVLLNLQWYSRCCCCWCWGGACESYWTSCRSNRSWLCCMVIRKEKSWWFTTLESFYWTRFTYFS